jgi:hypothetical protein
MELISYYKGMFANEPRPTAGPFDSAHELEATCYHEAAHAVVGYAFGEPIWSVGVCVDYHRDAGGRLSAAYAGEVRHGPPGQQRTVGLGYRPLYFRIGVGTAAGPAGEIRFRREAGLPLRLLGGSEGDHQTIDGIAKGLEQRGRSRFAFQRLVWYAAQRLVIRDDFWKAIDEVAQELWYIACDEQPEEPDTEQVWSFIEPSRVHSACRQAGLRRGMFRQPSPRQDDFRLAA